MSRPARIIISATFLSISLVFTGCKTIYSDVYSPSRNHFVPVKEKPKPALPPIIDTTPAPSANVPGLGLPPVAPAMPDAAPPVPGL